MSTALAHTSAETTDIENVIVSEAHGVLYSEAMSLDFIDVDVVHLMRLHPLAQPNEISI